MKIIILKIELVFFFLDKYNFKSFFLFFEKKNALNFIKKLENQLSNLIGNYALGNRQ